MNNQDQDPTPGEKPQVVSDQRLLERYCISQDEPAFRELVERYSRLVLGVCRRVLHNGHDAEEAFQATFMVLAAKATSLREHCSLGAWLHRVAYHTAVRAAQKRSRRRCEKLAEEVIVIDDVMENVTDAYRQQVLDEELNDLPKKYREPLVLHYLLGKTNKEVAATLRISERTVEGRQRQGKRLLRRRLVLRKVSLPLALAAIASSGPVASAALLEPLIETTVQASLLFAANQAATVTPIPSTHLAQKEILAMSQFSTPIASIVAVVAVVGIAVGLAGAEGSNQSAIPASPLVELPVVQAGVDNSKSFEDENVLPASSQQSTSKTLPKSFDLIKKSAARQRIEAELESVLKSPSGWIDERILDVISQLAEEFDIPIMFDHAALDELGISAETEVSIDLPRVKLRSALNLLFRQPGVEVLTYLIQDEVLLITTNERANASLETVVYDTRKLPGNDRLNEIILATIAPDSWQINGTGEGALEELGAGVLVIAQTRRVHQAIEELLTQLQWLEKN